MIIIGIAGGTGSGKTTVVRKIVESLSKDEVVILPLDSYYKDSSHVPVEKRQDINFDHPNAFDWELLSLHIEMLRRGEAIEQPVYSFLTCTRQPETVHVEPRKVVIIEGILALSDRKLCELMDLRIFVDADPDERLIRVIQRDVVERGRTAEAVMERYVKVLKPMHLEFIEPAKRIADLIIPQGGHNRKAIEILKMYIEKINGPADVKKLTLEELPVLAEEIRQALLVRASKHGGHFGPNFGMVEATIAMHYVFESPKDKIVYDVSHQSYPHKMLTGRKDAFLYEEHYDDVSGYSNPVSYTHLTLPTTSRV